MANIAITNYCNLQCPYCFADKFIKEEDKEMISLEQLSTILEFLSKSSTGRVGLIGGEPTLHPRFSDILDLVNKFCVMYKTRCVVFTNGINLYDYARNIGGNIGCLVNANHPDIIGASKWESLKKSLDRVQLCAGSDSITLGINLYPDMIDYDYIFELLKRYKRTRVRTSYVAPTCQFSNIDKHEYYEEAKNIFIPFVERAKSEGITVRLDCNHIPRCYFKEGELSLIDSVVEGFHTYCEPVVDITPDMKFTACFGAYELFDLRDFDNMLEVERFLRYKKLYPLAEANCSGKCSTCNKHQNLSCQGGCLAFAGR